MSDWRVALYWIGDWLLWIVKAAVMVTVVVLAIEFAWESLGGGEAEWVKREACLDVQKEDPSIVC